MPLSEKLEAGSQVLLGADYAGASPGGSDTSSSASPASAAGSEGMDGGSGADAGSLVDEDPEPPNMRFNQSIMRAMLQGRCPGR
jgi:hypothetical protein